MISKLDYHLLMEMCLIIFKMAEVMVSEMLLLSNIYFTKLLSLYILYTEFCTD